jgi:hypothetical protein
MGWRWSDGATFDDRLEYVRQWLEAEATGSEAAWLISNQLLQDGQSVTFDLGYLERDVLGDILITSLSEVSAVLLINHAADGGQLYVGGADVDAWDAPLDGGRLIVAPDGAVMLASRAAPWPVDGSHHNLRLAASGGDVMYSIALMGATPVSSSSGQ